MANLKRISKKLQRAILNAGLIIKINTYQFYSSEKKKIVYKYQITTPVFQKNKKGEWKYYDFQILSAYSMIDIIECLHDIYKAMMQWAEITGDG